MLFTLNLSLRKTNLYSYKKGKLSQTKSYLKFYSTHSVGMVDDKVIISKCFKIAYTTYKLRSYLRYTLLSILVDTLQEKDDAKQPTYSF